MKYYNLDTLYETFGWPYNYNEGLRTEFRKPLPDNPFYIRDGVVPYWEWKQTLVDKMNSQSYYAKGYTDCSGVRSVSAPKEWERHYCQATAKLDAWVEQCNKLFNSKIKSRYLNQEVKDSLGIV
jgi:hypothetical protein